jgi:hypothetical protein
VSVTLSVAKGKAFVVMWITQQRIPTGDRERPRSDRHVLGGGILAVDILNSTRYGGFGNNVGGGGLERGG